MPKCHQAYLAVSAIVCSIALASPSAHSEDFFAGKTVSLLVSSDPSGGFDTYTRLLAPYLQKYLPGKPTMVVQNMPGGGGLRVAQYMYSVAEKDGTKIGNVRAANALDSMLNIRGGDMDPTRFQWVGNMNGDTLVCEFSDTSGIRTVEDLRSRPTIVGSTGKGGDNYSMPNALNYVLGTKMKIVLGYQGTGDRVLASQRGEIDGLCGINASTLNTLEDLIKSGKLLTIVQGGRKPYVTIPDVPMAQSYARTDRERQILDAVFSTAAVARTYALPPGTQKDRVDTIREAFMKATRDPEMIAQATKMKIEVDPMPGEDLQRYIADMAKLPPEMKKEVITSLGE
ncbi:MAG TPA: tripartite tricarboxylate transporter substrate-binding protein [Alphaproteobacteria bacterium]|nr:tripartite tricarboxylate transporter substrate-binding protein [Alphaproteobacteria bacterium]